MYPRVSSPPKEFPLGTLAHATTIESRMRPPGVSRRFGDCCPDESRNDFGRPPHWPRENAVRVESIRTRRTTSSGGLSNRSTHERRASASMNARHTPRERTLVMDAAFLTAVSSALTLSAVDSSPLATVSPAMDAAAAPTVAQSNRAERVIRLCPAQIVCLELSDVVSRSVHSNYVSFAPCVDRPP